MDGGFLYKMSKREFKEPLITVFTPSYNRAHTLSRTYESLKRQTDKRFLWLIVDDGSSDGTDRLVDCWIQENNDFEIQYIYKENGGMHTAHNTAYENIHTLLNVCIDSDDYMTDNAIELILDKWEKSGNDKVAGIMALDVYSSNGKVIGSELPANVEMMSTDEFYQNGGVGDKKFIYRTEIINAYPAYPVFSNEKYVSLGYKYRLIAQDYKMLILNEPVCVVEYQEDGSSNTMWKEYYKNPKGFAFIRKINMKYTRSKKRLLVENIHYVSSSLLAKNPNFIKESPKKLLTILMIPFGFCLKILTIKKGSI